MFQLYPTLRGSIRTVLIFFLFLTHEAMIFRVQPFSIGLQVNKRTFDIFASLTIIPPCFLYVSRKVKDGGPIYGHEKLGKMELRLNV